MNARRSRLSVEFLEDRAVPAKAGGGITNPTPVGDTPAQIRHAYGFDGLYPDAVTYNQTAGLGQTIAIVMAGDQPNIVNDLKAFDKAFGLPDPAFGLPDDPRSFVKLTQTGSTTGPWP